MTQIPPIHSETSVKVVIPPRPSDRLHMGFKKHLRATFFAGLVWMFPLFISLYVLYVVYNFFTTFTKPAAYKLVPWLMHLVTSADQATIDNISALASPVFALILAVLVVYLMGILGTFVIGRRVLESIEHFAENLPLVKGIYGTTKQVVGVFRQGAGGSGFQRVVLVEFPRPEVWTIGFVTNTVTDTTNDAKFVCVFIPMTPNPTSGFFQIMPLALVRETDWTVDQGLKIVLSGGLLAPNHLPIGKPAEPTPAI